MKNRVVTWRQASEGEVEVPAVLAAPLGLLATLVLYLSGCSDEHQGREPTTESASAGSPTISASSVGAHTPASPLDAVHYFDQAEESRLEGDQKAANRSYFELIAWAAGNPLGDGWGSTALLPYAIWRWVRYAQSLDHADPDQVLAVIETDRELRNSRLSEGIFSMPVIDTLPQLREETLLHLATLAEKTGFHEAAQLLFLDYLAVARDVEMSDEAQALRESVIAAGWATADHIDLMRAQRLRRLRHFPAAEALLRELVNSEIEEVRVQASMDLAVLRFDTHAENLSPNMRAAVAELLGSVIRQARDPRLIQYAYFRRAIGWLREGQGRSVEKFISDIEALIREFPKGEMVPEALYQLAEFHSQDYRLTGNSSAFQRAMEIYERLRAAPRPHGREDSMYYRPALAFYTRGSLDGGDWDDLEESERLFRELEQTRPSGAFHLPSLLWRARIAEQRGHPEAARELWDRLAREDPFGYYGIRAEMHLEFGTEAKTQVLPEGEFKSRIAREYAASQPVTSVRVHSGYHERLNHVVGSGRYVDGLKALRQFRSESPITLRDASLSDLDERGLLADIVLLLATRLDAFAARDWHPTPENRLALSGLLGYALDDWPLALSILSEGAYENAKVFETRLHPAFLSTAYPVKDVERINRAAAFHENVPSDLLYTMMRRESLFDPNAVSPVGALGYFQFMPWTFDRLDERWNLLNGAGVNTREAFLFDGDQSIRLGARWFGEELLPRYSGNTKELFAVMDHNAGATAVRSWMDEWEALGRSRDIEYIIETARFAETRILARRLIRDLAIVRSSGLMSGASTDLVSD